MEGWGRVGGRAAGCHSMPHLGRIHRRTPRTLGVRSKSLSGNLCSRMSWRAWNDVGTHCRSARAPDANLEPNRSTAYTTVLPLPTPTTIPLFTFASTARNAASRFALSMGGSACFVASAAATVDMYTTDAVAAAADDRTARANIPPRSGGSCGEAKYVGGESNAAEETQSQVRRRHTSSSEQGSPSFSREVLASQQVGVSAPYSCPMRGRSRRRCGGSGVRLLRTSRC
jgi:hypothetical protein